MIVTVTMNPAVDKTIDITTFEHGGLNRITRTIQDAGGKGINVSKTIHELGGETIATGFLGGAAGQMIRQALKDQGIRTDFIPVSGETRTNTKMVEENGTVTELNEPGPVISKNQVEALIAKLDAYADKDALIVLSGSVPTGVDKDIYRKITQRMHAKGAKVLLDADGELFVNGLEAGPDIIKPNKVELEELFGMEKGSSQAEVAEMGEKLLAKGIGLIAISCGADGAMFQTAERKMRCEGLKVQAHSTVGAGDAMVAALAYGYHAGMELPDMIRLSVATSAGAVTTIGTKPPSRDLVDVLVKEVKIEDI